MFGYHLIEAWDEFIAVDASLAGGIINNCTPSG